MKIVAALTEPDSVIAYLYGVGLPARAPQIPVPDIHQTHDQAACSSYTPSFT